MEIPPDIAMMEMMLDAGPAGTTVPALALAAHRSEAHAAIHCKRAWQDGLMERTTTSTFGYRLTDAGRELVWKSIEMRTRTTDELEAAPERLELPAGDDVVDVTFEEVGSCQ